MLMSFFLPFAVVKPLIVDGSAKTHKLSLAYDPFSLSKLEPPLVLQEFVNHGMLLWLLISFCLLVKPVFDTALCSCLIAGGVLFKVYIVGETIRVVRRFSLPDVDERELLNNAGVFRFPRVSCAAASAEDADLDPGVAGKVNKNFLQHLAFSSVCRHSLSGTVLTLVNVVFLVLCLVLTPATLIF